MFLNPLENFSFLNIFKRQLFISIFFKIGLSYEVFLINDTECIVLFRAKTDWTWFYGTYEAQISLFLYFSCWNWPRHTLPIFTWYCINRRFFSLLLMPKKTQFYCTSHACTDHNNITSSAQMDPVLPYFSCPKKFLLMLKLSLYDCNYYALIDHMLL